MSDKKVKLIYSLILFSLMLSFFYLIIRLLFFILANNSWEQKAVASILLFVEIFGFVHSLGYFLNVLKVMRNTKDNGPLQIPPLLSHPPVAILVPSYKEPLTVLSDTLVCFYNLTYPNKQLYFLDDTRYDKPWDTPENVLTYRKSIEELCENIGVNLFRRKWRGAKAGIINDFLKFVDDSYEGNVEYLPFQKLLDAQKPKYFIVFDADMNALPNFVEPLVALMEANSQIAFIQTPQYYSNFELNKVARTAGFQQIVFYEYICEGKGLENIMFCCGTNVMIRKEALDSVGGFDESCVTEDVATSFKLHLNNWKSLYLNKVSAFGMGPEDLGGYFKQQFRWAQGTLSLLGTFLRAFFKNVRKIGTPILWWEYFLTCSHYLIGWTYFFMLIFPLLFIFLNVPIYFMDIRIFLAVFFPYLAISMYLVLSTLVARRHSTTGLLAGMIMITPVTFPVYMKAAICAFLGLKRSFVVTPKTKGSSLPLIDLWPQLLALAVCASGVVWGFDRIYYEGIGVFGLLGNMLWCIYNFIVLSSVFYFNDPDIE